MTFEDLRERPTATQPGASETAGSVRVSALVGGRASAAAEARRPLAERPVRPTGPLREECVCGGPEIVAVTFLPHDIVEAVRQHQIEPMHIAWDIAEGHDLALWQRVAGAVY